MTSSHAISIVTACRDRTAHLAQCLPTWLACRGVSEVVIVDWGSEPAVEVAVDVSDTRVRIVRVDGEDRWIGTMAWNLAFREASFARVAKIDCDDLLQPDFFDAHPLGHREFFAGNWKRAADADTRSLNGLVYLHAADFKAVNGYNERIRTYGWDDDDLYGRLERLGIRRRDIDAAKARHLPHDNIARSGSRIHDIDAEIRRNRDLAFFFPWRAADTLATYATRERAPGRLEFRRTPPPPPVQVTEWFRRRVGRSLFSRAVRLTNMLLTALRR